MPERIIRTKLVLGVEMSALKDLEAGLDSFRQKAGLAKRDYFHIRLALDELVTNSVSYGFSSGVGSGIMIEIALLPDNVCEILYSDDAPRFDPLSHTVAPVRSSIEEASVGGFGISFVKQMMDEVSYCYENGRNMIKMKKNVAAIGT